MICTTVRKGFDCGFMTEEGCSFIEGFCKPVLEKCDGCSRIVEFSNDKYCISYPDPDVKWKNGNCNFATHIKAEVVKAQKVNPIKASKRGGG